MSDYDDDDNLVIMLMMMIKMTIDNVSSKFSISSCRFVKVLETYIEKGGRFSVSTDNIAVHQQKIKKTVRKIQTNFTAKDNTILINTNNSCPGQTDASAVIPSSAFPDNDTANETVYFVYYKSSKLFAPNFQQVTVCEDGFTATETKKVERKGTSYTIERVQDRLRTESSPVLAASLKGREVVNLTQPIIIMFKLPPEMVSQNIVYY